jgi:uncharacterized protein (TIGR00369 family)
MRWMPRDCWRANEPPHALAVVWGRMSKLPYYECCFVCGDQNRSGLGARFKVDGDTVSTVFTPREPQMGYRGITHGGVLSALLDEAMGWAPSWKNKRFCVAAELNVRFIKPLPLGTEVTVSGRVTEGRGRLWKAEGEVQDASGTIYARGSGRYVSVGAEGMNEVMGYLTFDEGCVSREQLLGSASEEGQP